MKRFWVFGGYNYYPSGGIEDFQGSFETKLQAEEFVKQHTTSSQQVRMKPIRGAGQYIRLVETFTWGDWAQIVDVLDKL